MWSSLLRPKQHREPMQETSPFSSHYQSSPARARQERRQARHASADFTATDDDDELTEDEQEDVEIEAENDEFETEDDDADHEDGDEGSPLLPIFSAAHLDTLPVYNLTHAIRLIVLPRTETTLTWDQLRSPQVSSFLLKPMQQQIRSSHFSRATLYALMANCLQFQKEGHANPSNAGNSKTRAMVCELLAIKLLKEYTTRELIDTLSYDFYPLQGLSPEPSSSAERTNLPRWSAARTSTLEVAIRASAKKFLAHPSVVQQLEAIWAGTIVFHSAADNLHRKQSSIPLQRYTRPSDSRHLLVPGQQANYGSTSQRSPNKQFSATQVQPRRSVTLYDPRDASLFKLSRLRVPRYRQFFSTCSLAILLGLFLAVLSERSVEITVLEVVFWLWSAGFMLDEIVGFNEQGFSLYLMSFWNTFDVGILLLLMIYYCMRLYGLLLVESGRHEWNDMAYDVLAANAVLLFPRLFSVLDHYRYFSQLLIAFRFMAADLIAVSILILIACSGFFIAFTLSFGKNEYDAAGVAYKIFQILMGFTPAAWEAWDTYNPLGRAILVFFLFICHFLVVTILITVLTNSFMAIVSNANDEHQFLFAINTIAMVKNDALFSYLAPTNLFAWALTPLMFCLPFRAFIKLNRTVIKVTHFPLLFGIYAYEKLVLAASVFDATDLVENPSGFRKRLVSFHDKSSLFSPRIHRQESVAGFQQDNALEQVFQLPPRADTLRSTRKISTNKVVDNWMDHQGGSASPPQEQDRSIVDRLETRRSSRHDFNRRRAFSGTRSVMSDPADFTSRLFDEQEEPNLPTFTYNQPEDVEADDGDDERLTNDDHDETFTIDRSHHLPSEHEATTDDEEYFQTPNTTRDITPRVHPGRLSPPRSSPPQRRSMHSRNISNATILYNPTESSASPPLKSAMSSNKTRSRPPTGSNTPLVTGGRTPRSAFHQLAQTNVQTRPVLPARQNFQSVPTFNTVFDSDRTGSPIRDQRERHRPIRHRRSSLDMGMSDLGLEHLGPGANALGMVPSSFATQMAMANRFGGREQRELAIETERDTEAMMGRLMLARMKTLEEGFAEVVKEFRELSSRKMVGSSAEGSMLGGALPVKGKGKEKEKVKEKRKSREIGSGIDISAGQHRGSADQNRKDAKGDYFHDTHTQ